MSLVLLTAITSLLATPALEGEELGGHRFLAPQLQESGFVVTSVTSRFGMGVEYARDVPLADLGSRTLTVGGLEERLELMLRLHPVVAVFLDLNGTALTGLNTETIILRTGELQGDMHVGGIVRLLRSENTGTQLSARLRGGLASGERFGVMPLFRAAVEDPNASAEAVLNGNFSKLVLVPTSAWTARAGLHLAQALSPLFGLLAATGLTYTHRTEKPFQPAMERRVAVKDDGVRADAALALAVNGAAKNVPVALLGEYRYAAGATAQLESNDAPEHTAGTSIVYSGRTDAQLGVEGSYRLAGPRLAGVDAGGATALSKPLQRYTADIVFRYTW